MQTITLGNRRYRTNGEKSEISGRLLHVEYQNAAGNWHTVRNPSRRDQVLAALESGVAA